MAELYETLLRYVPAPVLRKIAQRSARLSTPQEDTLSAAALYADLTGLAIIVEQLAQRGPAGVKELSQLFNEYFSELTQIIDAYQGEVIRFTGDGLLALWLVDEAEPLPPAGESGALTESTCLAGQCGLAIQSALSDYRYKALPEAIVALRIGIGAGEVTAVHIGGVFGRWEYVLSGSAVVQTGHAGNHARPGEVILSPQAWQLASDRSRGQVVEEGCVRLVSISSSGLRPALPTPLLTSAKEADLRAYLPGALLNQLEQLQAGSNLGEIRRLSILNILLPEKGSGQRSLQQAQNTMQTLQKALYRYEGSIYRLSVDENGVQFIAALGLPPFAHEDDPSRAAQAALAMRRELQNLGLSGTIGITTGYVYCGSIGGNNRQEYILAGTALNFASRLAQTPIESLVVGSSGAGVAGMPALGIVCDRNTYQAARAQIDFEVLQPVRLKGWSEPVSIYVPIRLKNSLLRSRAEMIGRLRERSLLAEALQNLLRTQKTQVLIIEASAGMGKTRLVGHLMKQAGQMQIDVLYGNGEENEKTTPYFPWKKILSQAFGISELVEEDEIQRRVSDSLDGIDRLFTRATLLNNLLPVSFDENELTSHMDGHARADNTRELLLGLLSSITNNSPKVLVIEDAQWLDSASWSLLYHASQQASSLLLIIASRPEHIGEDLHPQSLHDHQRLCNASNCQIIPLDPLNSDEILELVSQTLGVNSLPRPVANLIVQNSGGHPFHAEELGYALRDWHLIEIENGECSLPGGAEALDARKIPELFPDLILSRIELLNDTQKLLLQIASTIGRVFTFQILQEIYPEQAESDALLQEMEILDQLDITLVELTEQGTTYTFRHAITQEVIYAAMPSARRRQFHLAIAKWYEENNHDQTEDVAAILAYHYKHALGSNHDVLESSTTAATQAILGKAIEFSILGANHLSQQGLFQESINLLSTALKLETSLNDRYPTLERASWQRLLAESYHGLGQTENTIEHLTQALTTIGMQLPTKRNDLIVSIASGTLQRIWAHLTHRNLPPTKSVAASSTNQRTNLEAARLFDILAGLHFFSNDRLRLADAALQVINHCEALGPSPELARGYAGVCAASGSVPLHVIAQRYRAMAQETARSINHPLVMARAMLYSNIYSIGVGDWNNAVPEIQKAVALFQEIGHRHLQGEGLTILGLAQYFRGDFENSLASFEQAEQSATYLDNPVQLAQGLTGAALSKIRLGLPDEGSQIAQNVLNDFQETAPDPIWEFKAYSALGWAAYQKGNWQSALEAYNELKKRINDHFSPLPAAFEGFALIVLVPLALWEAWVDPDHANLREAVNRPGSQGAWKRDAQMALRVFHSYAGHFPIARARTLLYQGLYHWLSDQHQDAQTSWLESLQAARKLDMPYDEALACLELGRHAVGEAQKEYLEYASRIFTRCNSAFELKLTQALLAGRLAIPGIKS